MKIPQHEVLNNKEGFEQDPVDKSEITDRTYTAKEIIWFTLDLWEYNFMKTYSWVSDLLLLCNCSIVSDSATPHTVASHALQSMEFSRQEYWSGLPFPFHGIFQK